MSSAQALSGAPLAGTGPAPRLAALPPSGRPEIVRETGHAHGAAVVEKPLSITERLYNQAWLFSDVQTDAQCPHAPVSPTSDDRGYIGRSAA